MLQQTSLRAFSLFHILFQIEYGANLIFVMKFIFQLSVRKRVAKNIHENKGNNQFDSCQEHLLWCLITSYSTLYIFYEWFMENIIISFYRLRNLLANPPKVSRYHSNNGLMMPTSGLFPGNWKYVVLIQSRNRLFWISDTCLPFTGLALSLNKGRILQNYHGLPLSSAEDSQAENSSFISSLLFINNKASFIHHELNQEL